jgi:DNA ligase (NAD+)
MENLITQLNDYTVAYDAGNPLISDKEWDDLYFQLVNLENTSGIYLPNSPTQIIHYQAVNELEKVTHSHPMLSLEKTKDVAAAANFVSNQLFLVMCKMDGLTCSLTYKNGKLVAAETRGNGTIGENILHNANVIPSIPKRIPYQDELIIDGEIICTYEDFKPFSTEYKNPRNFASGSIRLLDSKECAKRNLTFVAWDVINSVYSEDQIEYRVDQKLDMIKNFGFTIVPFHTHTGFLTTEKVMGVYLEDVRQMAEKASYPIDGVVIKYADCAYGRSLGATAHHFRNALAYKFYDETYSTILKDIEWTMGRTGAITPVAVFEAIDIDGSTVERASLHNLSVMWETLQCLPAAAGLTPIRGQEVEVFKANAIIPQIAKSSLNNLKESLWEFIEIPKVCPICGGETTHRTDANSTILYCTNPNCEGKLINKLDHFCGKKGLDIKGLSKATLEKLINLGWVNCYTDLFKLKNYEKEWIKLPGFGAKSVGNILNAIENSRTCDLAQFIAALGIPLIGTSAAKDLANHFLSWESFIDAVDSKYAFYSLNGFGGEMHSSLSHFDYAEARELATNHLLINSITINNNNLSLDGLTFVITGKVNHFKNRDEIKSLIESLGGKVSGSVSKNTNYLINNDVASTSSKNRAAQSLGIPILSEETFIETFGIN